MNPTNRPSPSKLARRRRGQGMTEYIIIVSLIAISSIGVVTLFGDQIKALFGMAVDALSGQQTVAARTEKSNARLERSGGLAHYADHNSVH